MGNPSLSAKPCASTFAGAQIVHSLAAQARYAC